MDSEDKEWSGQNWELLTLEMLLSTPSGVTSPTTVTFFVAISMSKELTPSILEMCFLTLPAHPLQCRDTLSTTTWCWPVLVEQDLVMAVFSPAAERRPVSDDDEEEEEEDAAPADGSGNNSTGRAPSCGHAGREGRDVPSPRSENMSSSMNAGRGDGSAGKESAPGMSSSSMNEGRRGDDGSGGRESKTVMSSSDCIISLDELSRNLEELAGFTRCSCATACCFLFFLCSDGVDELPPPPAAAPSALFFFLLSLPSSWWW